MQAMGWSWPDLEATPTYVKQYCWDLLTIKRAEEGRRIDAHRSKGRR